MFIAEIDAISIWCFFEKTNKNAIEIPNEYN